MHASEADSDLANDENDRKTDELEEPRDSAARLPGEAPEGLNVESLEERVLLSADAAAQAAAAPAAAPPEEPPALVGSPVAGESADAGGSHAEPIVTDGRSGASASDAGEVVAELAKSSNQAAGGGEGEHKLSHSTESGEIGELKTEASSERASEVNESERLELSAKPENKAGDEQGEIEKQEIVTRRPLAGEVHAVAGEVHAGAPANSADAEIATAPAETAPEIIAAQMIAADAAVEANGNLLGESLQSHAAADIELRHSVELSGVGNQRAGDHLPGSAEGAVSSGAVNEVREAGQTAAAVAASPAGASADHSAKAEPTAAMVNSHAEQLMAELKTPDNTADAVPSDSTQQASAPAQSSQSVDAPQAHDAYFAALPDLAAHPAVDQAIAAPILAESAAKAE